MEASPSGFSIDINGVIGYIPDIVNLTYGGSMYLTEQRLGEIIKNVLGSYTFEHDKIVPNSSLRRMRPDYRCEDLKLILEFNGYSHYCNPIQILNDYKKAEEYKRLGYTVISIPYFIQMCDELVSLITLGKVQKYKQEYPHGFIDPKAVLPSFFCSLGIVRYKQEMDGIFNFAKADVEASLDKHIKEGKDPLTVRPL